MSHKYKLAFDALRDEGLRFDSAHLDTNEALTVTHYRKLEEWARALRYRPKEPERKIHKFYSIIRTHAKKNNWEDLYQAEKSKT